MKCASDRRDSGSRFADRRSKYVPSAASFLAVSMQEIGAFSAKSKIGSLGGKGRILRGQDKRTWHYVAHVLEIIVVGTLFRWCASGTPFFTPLVPRFRAKPWRCWFSAGTMAAECAIFGSFGRDATMSGGGKIASGRSPIFPARYGNGATQLDRRLALRQDGRYCTDQLQPTGARSDEPAQQIARCGSGRRQRLSSGGAG